MISWDLSSPERKKKTDLPKNATPEQELAYCIDQLDDIIQTLNKEKTPEFQNLGKKLEMARYYFHTHLAGFLQFLTIPHKPVQFIGRDGLRVRPAGMQLLPGPIIYNLKSIDDVAKTLTPPLSLPLPKGVSENDCEELGKRLSKVHSLLNQFLVMAEKGELKKEY